MGPAEKMKTVEDDSTGNPHFLGAVSDQIETIPYNVFFTVAFPMKEACEVSTRLKHKITGA